MTARKLRSDGHSLTDAQRLERLEAPWCKIGNDLFAGKTVACFHFVDFNNGSRAPAIAFTDGTWLLVSADPEGNGAGAIFVNDERGNLVEVIG